MKTNLKKVNKALKENNPILHLIEILFIIAAFSLSIISICNSQSSLIISKHNSNTTYNAYREEHRPVAILDSSFISLNIDNNNKLFLEYKRLFHNDGPGRMIYVGYLSYISPIFLKDFRSNLLNGQIEEIIPDRQDYQMRRYILIRGCTWTINSYIDKFPFYTESYLYTLVFYEDESGNLYDTEIFQKISFENKKIIASSPMMLPYIYNDNDKNNLIKQLCKLYNPIVDFGFNGHCQ